MGYSTDFEGQLTFKSEPTIKQIQRIQELIEQEPERGTDHDHYIDLELTLNPLSIKWNGNEKTRGMVESLNWIIRTMRHEYDDFWLEGELQAQGEGISDRWQLRFDLLGIAYKLDTPPTGNKTSCPHCDHEFYFEPIKKA